MHMKHLGKKNAKLDWDNHRLLLQWVLLYFRQFYLTLYFCKKEDSASSLLSFPWGYANKI